METLLSKDPLKLDFIFCLNSFANIATVILFAACGERHGFYKQKRWRV